MPKAVLIWKYKGSSKPLSLSPSKDAERIAVCFSNSEIHMLDKNGKLSWKIDSNSSGHSARISTKYDVSGFKR